MREPTVRGTAVVLVTETGARLPATIAHPAMSIDYQDSHGKVTRFELESIDTSLRLIYKQRA